MSSFFSRYHIPTLLIWLCYFIFREYEKKRLIGTGWNLIEVDMFWLLMMMLAYATIFGFILDIYFKNKEKRNIAKKRNIGWED